MTVYLDNAATTMPREEAIAAALHVMQECYGNPSSAHFMGREAARELESARKSVAAALGAAPGEVHFTSGGTEADNWAILGLAEARARRGRHIVTSSIEHDAVRRPMEKLQRQGWEVTYLEPDSDGVIPVDAFAGALREDTTFASVMLVNNETGAINPVADYANEIRRRSLDIPLHTDAVQGFCKLPFTVKSLGADLITVSAHKIHGVKGAGALYVKSGVRILPLLLGGGQEREGRSGTEAVPALAAFGAAARCGAGEREETFAAVRSLRERVTSRLDSELPDAVIISPDNGSPFILSLSLPGYKSEVLMNFLESKGICVSKSAACKKGARSRVLEAMRLPNDVIDGALRVSFSRYNTDGDADMLVDALIEARDTLVIRRKSRPVPQIQIDA